MAAKAVRQATQQGTAERQGTAGQGKAQAVKAHAGKARDASRGAGRQAANHPALKILARGGFLARGLMYVIIGWIALEIAFGHSSQQADRSGAVQELGRNPAGEVALWLLAIGFFGMALWRLTEVLFGSATVGEPQRGKRKAVFHRLTAVGKVVLYGALGYSVLEYALGTGGSQSSDTESVDLTANLLQHAGGQVLVAAIGAVLVITGAVLGYQAWREKFLEAMDLSGLRPRARRAVAWLGRAGGIARGVVIVTAGVFLFIAAVDVQPGQAKGVDSALRALADTPAGPWLLVIVALGLIMFGVFSGCEARWRKV
jgi:Domain of Unknown Function (DUF1206)